MLKELKLLLGLESNDCEQDKKLNWILDASQKRLKNLLGGIEPPEELKYVIVEVSVVRFNRISSEGMAINQVEGESLHFSNNDFAGYMDEINAWLDARNRMSQKGGLKFL